MVFDTVFNHYLQEFQTQGEPYLKVIANCAVPSRIVRMKYKEIPPLSTLPYTEKKELWLYAKESFPDETKNFRVRFMEIVYTIGTLL